jgi:hypothetical protein
MAVCLGDSQALAAFKLPLRLLILERENPYILLNKSRKILARKIHENLNKNRNPPKFPFTLASHFPAFG